MNVDATEVYTVGDEIKVTVMGFDKKARVINLTVKDLLSEDDTEMHVNTQLGDLLKEQMDMDKNNIENEESN
jgi:ribosomal protein S1